MESIGSLSTRAVRGVTNYKWEAAKKAIKNARKEVAK
jgi:hypothetical protein